LRSDKDWKQALSFDEFIQLKSQVEGEQEEKKLKIDDEKRQKSRRKRKRDMVIQGNESEVKTPYAGPATKVFDGLSFFIMTEAPKPIKKTKAELEELVKANGGKVVASEKDPDAIIIDPAQFCLTNHHISFTREGAIKGNSMTTSTSMVTAMLGM
jgi:DNA ligase-4